jgi:DNA-binding HxlR family transcriptional regulator
VKSYGQRCPLARALDVVGDRWALLVVRELTLGPRRYTDLLDGLPGIGTNVLATRLAGLQQAGVVTKEAVPPPTAVTVYRLTEAGEALEPALAALTRWGTAHGRSPADGDALRPGWLLMRVRAAAPPTTLGADEVVELDVDGDVFTLSGEPGGGLGVRSGGVGAGRAAGARIEVDLGGLVRLLTRPQSPPERQAGLTLTGDAGLARSAVETLAGSLDPATTA